MFHRTRSWSCALTIALTSPLHGCSEDEASSNAPNPAEEALNQLFREQFPEGAPGPDQRDEANNLASQVMPEGNLTPGQGVLIGVGLDMDEVDAICVSFGTPDNPWCVPASSMRVNSDNMAAGLMLSIPPDLCDQLSRICHDIRCYESARTSAGLITRSNVNQLAMICGGCDEPSCQPLLDMCVDGECTGDGDCRDGERCVSGQCVGEGLLRFTLSWSEVADVDLYVTTPSGSTIFYGNPTADGGELDRDNVNGGPGSIENIFFDAPSPGQYQVNINNLGPAAATARVEAFIMGAQVEQRTLNLGNGDTQMAFTVSYP